MADQASPASADRGVVLRPLAQFVGVGLAAVLIVGLATAAASRRVGQREAITNVRSEAIIKAQRLVEPVLDDAVVAGEPTAIEVLARVVREQVLDDSLVRVKLWTPAGRVVWSDAEGLVGATYDLGQDERDAITSGLVVAHVSDLDEPENRFERAFGKLLEVYLPVRTAGGDRLLFEAYFRYDEVAAAGGDIWRSFAPVAIGALVVLELVQIPLAWSLARQLRQRQRERETLLRRAVDASDVERRRIASDLHDGVVQDLVGLSFELAGAARAPDLPPTAGAALADASSSVRATITALRSMLLDIYPPDLHEVGLRGALEDLAAGATDERRSVRVDAEATLVEADLGRDARQLLYRGAREAVRNVVRHSGATEATIRAGGRDGLAWIEVVDDGSGVDPADVEERAGEGHLGLRGLRGVVQDAGGTLQVERGPIGGTVVRVEVPIR